MDNTEIDLITFYVVLSMITLVLYVGQLMMLWNRDKTVKSRLDYLLFLIPGGVYLFWGIGFVNKFKGQFSFFKGLPWV